MRSIFLISSLILLLILLIEGALSYYYSLNYYSKKETWDSFKDNSLSNKEVNFLDPYSDQIKSHKRKLSNRYTFSMQGRWAPNTLARKYTYNNFKEGIGLFTDNYGFIHNGNPNRKINGSGKNNTILIGGSTAEGANTTSNNENTISANLEKILRVNNKNINIINAGHSGYKSFDEYLMIYNLLGNFKFQNVIFFHGGNDFLSYVYSKNKKWNYYEEIINYNTQYLSNLSAPLYKFKTLYYAGLIFDRIGNLFNFKNFNKKKHVDPLNTNLFQKEYDTHHPYTNMDDYERLYKNYVYNLRLIKSLCTEFKINCKIFLQPTIGQKNIRHNYEEEYFSKVHFKNFIQSSKVWFKKVNFFGSQIEKNNFFQFYDLTDVFINDENLVYYDLLHYNDYGNKKIAEAISKFLQN
jgi:hypothetical protein